MNETSRQYGVLLVSAARHQGAFAAILARHPLARLVAVADDPDCEPWVREANQKLADQWQIPYLDDLDAALARPDVDIASVCSFYRYHARHSMLALRAGKHVLLDKQPLAMSMAEAHELAAVAREAAKRGCTLTYIHHSFDTAVIRAKESIDAGEIGRPLAVYARTVANYGPGDDPNTEPAGQYGRGFHPDWWNGGELIHHGAYVIGCARYLMGSDVTSVFGFTGTHFNRLHMETGIDDLTTLSMRHANGGAGTVMVGRAPNPAAIARLDHFVHVLGTDGIVTASWEEPVFLLCEAAAGRGRFQRYGIRADERVIDQLLAAIVEGGEPLHGIDDGLAELNALLAGITSIQTGTPVDLAEVA